MNYDFNKEVIRRGTDCMKWDEAEDGVLPLWIADMDFETAPCIHEAILRRARHGIFGYNLIPGSFYESIIWWNSHRHGWTPRREWMLYTSGVVPALSAIIKGLCRAGDGVLFFTPAYNCFFSSVRNNDCRLVEFPLTWSPSAERYSIDFGALEQTLDCEHPRLLLLCNPHNPTGRVWTREELSRIAALCAARDIVVLSDEIHCEFVDPALGRPYLPFAPIADDAGCMWVIANAPNKAFNIAGLQTAYIVTADDDFRTRIDHALNVNEVCDINCFSFVALQAAYTPEGEEWLNQLVAYIYGNYRYFRATLKAAFPDGDGTKPRLPIAPLEGTYLAWADVSAFVASTPFNGSSERLAAQLRSKQRVWINGGEMYGQAGFLRVNLATQRSRLEEALRRIIEGMQG